MTVHNKTGGCCGGCCCHHEVSLTADEKQFLSLFAATAVLPMAHFLLRSTKSDHLESVVLSPVYLTARSDNLDAVKATGEIIKHLESHHLILLDEDTPIKTCDYSDYEQSDAFAYLKETVAEGQTIPGFIFDVAALEFGSMKLTEFGQAALEKIKQGT